MTKTRAPGFGTGRTAGQSEPLRPLSRDGLGPLQRWLERSRSQAPAGSRSDAAAGHGTILLFWSEVAAICLCILLAAWITLLCLWGLHPLLALLFQ